MSKIPRKLSLITLTDDANAHWLKSDPTRFHDPCTMKVPTLLFLGEIPNMRGHCVVIGQAMGNSPKMLIGYHTDNFRELTEEEV